MEKRTLYALIGFFVFGLGAFFALRAPEKGDRSGPKPRPIPALKAADIQALELTSEKQEKVTLAKSGTAWKITSPKEAPADSAGVKSLLDALEKLAFGDMVTDQKDKQDEMGVGEGKADRVVVKGAGDKVLADLFIGKNVAGYTMARPAGKDEVWQTTGLYSYLLNKDAKAWRDHVIFEFPSNEGDKLSVEAGNSKLTVSKLEEKDDKAKLLGVEAKWKIEESTGDAPKTSEALDVAMVNAAVQALSTLRSADFADDKPATETGLGAPVLKVTVTAAGMAHKLLVGSTKGDDTYLQAEGNPTLFTIKKFSFERVNHKPADYRDKTLAKVKDVDLASVEVVTGGESLSLTHAGDKWKAGKPVDDSKVKPMVSAFENLTGGSISEEKDPAKTGLAKPTGVVTLKLKEKSAITLKVGALSADKSEYYIQKVGSPDVLIVKKYMVDRFLKKASDLAPAAAAPAPAPTKTAAAPTKKK
jgi:hypothetical protein